MLPQVSQALGLTGPARWFGVAAAIACGIAAVATKEGNTVVLQVAEDVEAILPLIQSLTAQGKRVVVVPKPVVAITLAPQ